MFRDGGQKRDGLKGGVRLLLFVLLHLVVWRIYLDGGDEDDSDGGDTARIIMVLMVMAVQTSSAPSLFNRQIKKIVNIKNVNTGLSPLLQSRSTSSFLLCS